MNQLYRWKYELEVWSGGKGVSNTKGKDPPIRRGDHALARGRGSKVFPSQGAPCSLASSIQNGVRFESVRV